MQESFETKLSSVENQKSMMERKLRARFTEEQMKTQSVVEKMEQMKLELKMMESQDSSVTNIWRKKCLDLFDVCQNMKGENEELRSRCKELIEQGINLSDAIGSMDHQEISNLGGSQKINMPGSAGIGSMGARPMVSTSNTFNNNPPNTGLRYHVGSS